MRDGHAHQGRHRPRDRRRSRPADRPPRRAAALARRRSARATGSPSTASSAPHPNCSSTSTVGVVRSHPLAGTAPRTGDVDLDAEIAEQLVASTKDQVEHRVVIDVVHDTLLPWCSFLDWEPEPSIVTVANVQHLGTRDRGPALGAAAQRARARARAVAHPGARWPPAADALQLIAEVEGVDRGRYGGAVGWVDAAATARGPWPSAAPSCRRPAPRPPPRRRRHRRRQRPAGRAGRDAGQVPGDAVGADPAVVARFRRLLASSTIGSASYGQNGRPSERAATARSAPRGGRRSPRDRCDPRRTGPAWHAGRQLRRPRDRRRVEAVGGGERDDVGAVRRPEELLEALAVESSACGRNEKIPPPSLSTTTMRRSARGAQGGQRAMSWTSAMSPTRATVGPPPSATPSAVDTTPSMPLAPRLA